MRVAIQCLTASDGLRQRIPIHSDVARHTYLANGLLDSGVAGLGMNVLSFATLKCLVGTAEQGLNRAVQGLEFFRTEMRGAHSHSALQ
jgi:hypothetical protein